MPTAIPISAQQEGNHTIFIGVVEKVGVQEGGPLLFYADRYRKLEPDTPGKEQS